MCACILGLALFGLFTRSYAVQLSPAPTAATIVYSSFAYTQMTSDRYATPLPSPVTFQSSYAPPFSNVSTLLQANITYTIYTFDRNITYNNDGVYGQSAYVALWDNYTYSTEAPFTTTVSPTPIPSSELVFPPVLHNAPQIDQNASQLPPDFVWGVAGSAWQIEGGLQLEGRGPGQLDTIGAIDNPTSGNDSNTADMNYFLYKQDIARLAALGVPYYSFSISWSRVVPFGLANSPVNTQALEHYEDVISTCLEYGVTPIVTLMHVDNPVLVSLEDETLREHFLYYAKLVMTRFADRVPVWITFNEPNLVGYFYGYTALPKILLAHADVYHWYKETLKGTGRISTKISSTLALPLDPSNPDDVEAANRYQDFQLGIMSNPLYLGQQYPEIVRNTSGVDLPALTDDEIAYVNGTCDFYALDAYISQFASPAPEGISACASNTSDPLFPTCATLSNTQLNGWTMGARSNAYSYIAPQYVRQQLGYVWNTFRPSGLMITEFGFPVYGEYARALEDQRHDLERSLYYQDFLAEVLKSIYEDGVNVIGSLAWSFADNNEFGSYENQYGLQTVNRTDGLLTRHYKRSIFDLVDFFSAHISAP
ncbi:beta-glucosidase [Diaporthe amygdali]|uniref:beta-glucosidase n=1 Tax=Phomopsis amygdali TaxID=1214568 RepID=UPI0022FE51CA|nr:beta-glucosidase [Diaporthe amygdali]KAJ0120215.1 beta-glucosidase [Diaporthe amygdali]